jgi:hypothetical protein
MGASSIYLGVLIAGLVCLVIGTNSAFKDKKPSTPGWISNTQYCCAGRDNGDQRYVDVPEGTRDAYPIIAYSKLRSVAAARNYGLAADVILTVFLVCLLAIFALLVESNRVQRICCRLAALFAIYLILYVAFCHSYTYFSGAFLMANNVTPVQIINGKYQCNGYTRYYPIDGIFLIADLECKVVPNHEVNHSNLTAGVFMGIFAFFAVLTPMIAMHKYCGECECDDLD